MFHVVLGLNHGRWKAHTQRASPQFGADFIRCRVYQSILIFKMRSKLANTTLSRNFKSWRGLSTNMTRELNPHIAVLDELLSAPNFANVLNSEGSVRSYVF